MSKVSEIVAKISRKWMKIRLQPIRVFCFHQVSDVFEPDTMWECAWMQTDEFKEKILRIRKEGVTFISLAEATDKLKHDRVRCKKYAVLTADDGWASMKNILPWLAEHGIPITLFINPLYLDGVHKQERETEKLLTKEELEHIAQQYPLVNIASHGWLHTNYAEWTDEEFRNQIMRADRELRNFYSYIPYMAFPYGKYTQSNLSILQELQIIPVYIDGMVNWNDSEVIHREDL